MNNNEWMNKGLTKLKEGLIYTFGIQMAASIKLQKIDFTNAFQKLLICFSNCLT